MITELKPSISRSVVAWSMLATCCLMFMGGAEVMAAQEKQTEGENVVVDSRTRKALAAWEGEKSLLLAEIGKIEAVMERTLWQQEKARIYRETLESKIQELKQRATEMETINAELLPVLDQTLERLKIVVDADLPFDQVERHKKLEQAEDVLGDYDLGLLAKTRTVFDATTREVDIGYSVDVTDGEITLDEQFKQVRLLQVGRVGLYALTLDGRSAYEWNRKQNTFIALDGGARGIGEAIEMAEGVRLVGMSSLPMGRLEKIENTGGFTLEMD